MPAIIPRAVGVCWANNAPIPGTTIVTRPVAAVIRRRVAAVISRGIAAIIAITRSAIIAITRSAIVAVTWAIGVGAGGYATNHRRSN
jgi:hypothetical protein